MKKNNTFFFSPSFYKGFIFPLLLWFIFFTPFSKNLDLNVSQYFYDRDHFQIIPFWHFFFLYGFWPAWVLAFSALGGFILSYINSSYRSWRLPCIYLIMTFAVGSGLIVNVIFKDHWGRPRPRQVTEFGGQEAFRPYYQPPSADRQNSLYHSFPSGHASTGFYFFSLAFLGAIYRSRLTYYSGLTLAWGLGILLSLSRMIEGGHFLSDTLGAALIMWLTSWGLAYLFFSKRNGKEWKT